MPLLPTLQIVNRQGNSLALPLRILKLSWFNTPVAESCPGIFDFIKQNSGAGNVRKSPDARLASFPTVRVESLWTIIAAIYGTNQNPEVPGGRTA